MMDVSTDKEMDSWKYTSMDECTEQEMDKQ